MLFFVFFSYCPWQELLRCSNAEGERSLAQLEQLNTLHWQTAQDSLMSTMSRVLPNGAVELINTPQVSLIFLSEFHIFSRPLLLFLLLQHAERNVDFFILLLL